MTKGAMRITVAGRWLLLARKAKREKRTTN
jgi:hypothetical protein